MFVGPYRFTKDQYVDQVKRGEMKLDGEARYVDMMVTMASINKTIEKVIKEALPFERMTLSLHMAKKTGGYTRQWNANARADIDSPRRFGRDRRSLGEAETRSLPRDMARTRSSR